MPNFQDLKNPRRETKSKLQKLSDILIIVVCAMLSGIEDRVCMKEFAKVKEAWLREFLELPNEGFSRCRPGRIDANHR